MPAMATEVLRQTGDDAAPRVTNMELFFDLVYVFAITQVSDFLSGHLTGRGLLETTLLFVPVFWAWNYTAWATNWIDPERPFPAAVMVVMMVLGLVMAAALPDAFGGHLRPDRALPFAVTYTALQLVRTGFVAWAFPAGDRMRANNLALLAWLAVGGALWITGACLHGDLRLIVWFAAAVLELAAPLHGFWLPGKGATPIEAWRLTGTHLAERYQLVLIIALGESVLRVGATFADRSGSFSVDAAFIVGFLGSAALWAVYFLRLADVGATAVADAEERAARLGRSAYAYAHAIMVAGVIVVAVAIRRTIEAPTEAVSADVTALVLGGPALFLAGYSLFEHSIGLAAIAGRPWAAIAVLGLLVLAAVAGAATLVLTAAATAVLLGFLVFVWRRPYHRHPRLRSG
jgi:low temperature requirement protein LtrA